MYHFLKVFRNNLATMTKNVVAKDLRTPKYKQRKVESKKKYNRKKKKEFRNLYVNDQLVGVHVMLRAFLCTLAIVLIALRPKLAGYHRVP